MSRNTFRASVQLWNECNFNCTFCIGARTDIKKKDWQVENNKLKKLRELFSESGKWEVSFIGGEPMVNPYLGNFCDELLSDGHAISGIITNASIPLRDFFSKDVIKQMKWLRFSYHPAHEENLRLNERFEENIRYAVEQGITPTVVYVLLPERVPMVPNIIGRFEGLGAKVSLDLLYGNYNGRTYPTEYSQGERKLLNQQNGVVLRQLLEDGGRVSTLQVCSAGYSSFEIFLQSGRIVPCTTQQSFEMFNFLEQDINIFNDKIFSKPEKCLMKKCVCGYSYKQEKFLENNINYSAENYNQWLELTRPNIDLREYWRGVEEKFVIELNGRIKGNNVYLWGAGIHTAKVLELLEKNGFTMHLIKGIVDSNTEKDGELFSNIPVFSAENYFRNKSSNCSEIIISSACFENEIYIKIVATLQKTNINIIRLYDGSFKHIVPI